MRKIYLLHCLVFFLFSTVVKAQLPTKCFEIQSILVDACGNPEGANEQVRVLTGPNPITISSITTTWPNNSFNGYCQNATTALKVDSLNQTILKCGWILEPPAGVIPPYKQVIFFTSVDMSVAFNSFADLTDTIYAVFQCAGNTAGHFANFNGTSALRTLIFSYSGGCRDTVAYDRSLLTRQNGTVGSQDGGAVLYNFAGNASYYNNGCQAAIPISTVFAGNDTTVCPITTILGLKGKASGIKSTAWASTGSGTFSQKDSLNTNYTLSVTDVYPITFYLKGFLACGDSIQDTIVYNKFTNTVNAGVDDSICLGTSLNGLASGGSNYSWLPTNGVSNPSSATPVLSPTATTDYIVTANYGVGCVGVDTVKITVFAIDTIVLTKDTTICFGQTVQLNATNVASVVFSPATDLSCTACLTPVSSPNGTITYTAMSNGYCPDTNTVSITVQKPTTAGLIIDVCDSVFFLTKTYYASATVIDTTKSSLGCDSIIRTTQINVYPTTVRDTFHCIIAGDSVLIAGVYQKNPGQYLELLPNGICSDKLIHHLQVVAIQTVNVPIVACNSTVYKGTTYTSSTTVSDTLRTLLGCDSVYTIANITINNNSSVYNKSVCINSGQTYFAGGANQTTSGVYRDTFALSSGCDSIIATNLQVITIKTNNNGVQACKSYTYKGVEYTSDTVIHETPILSVLGCDSVYNNFAIAINNQVSVASISDCILKGQVYVLGSKQCGTTGVYRDTTALPSGCDSITTLTLNVIDTFTINDVVKSCNPYVYNGTTYTTTTTVHETLYQSVQGCDSVYHDTYIVISPFQYDTTVHVCINDGNTYFAGGANQSTSGLYTDKYTTALGCDSFHRTNLNVIQVKQDTVRLDSCNSVVYNGTTYTQNASLNSTISSVQGCDSIEKIVLINIHTLSVSISESNGTLPVNYGETIQLNAIPSSAVKSYTWTPSQYVVGSTSGASIVSKPETNTTYQVVVKDSFCTASSSFVVNVVEPETKFAMPTAFTPNGDGVNDVYHPVLMPNLVTREFRIYNRWGEKVFESTSVEPGWDGTYRDSKQPVGVYVYYISVQNTVTNKTVYHSGNITLIR